MKYLAIILIFIFISGCTYSDLDEVMYSGHRRIEEYCLENSLGRKYGIIDIENTDIGISLRYLIYTKDDNVHDIILYFNRRGEIVEFHKMIDTEIPILTKYR